ncbi:MAG: hypothetical protein ACRDPW_08325 [Mycobacteriales bacterium]
MRGGWESTGQQWRYDRERYTRVAAARETEQQAMLCYQTTSQCRMEFLRRQLDDPDVVGAAAPCGRCDNCTGQRLDATVSARTVAATSARLQRRG